MVLLIPLCPRSPHWKPSDLGFFWLVRVSLAWSDSFANKAVLDNEPSATLTFTRVASGSHFYSYKPKIPMFKNPRNFSMVQSQLRFSPKTKFRDPFARSAIDQKFFFIYTLYFSYEQWDEKYWHWTARHERSILSTSPRVFDIYSLISTFPVLTQRTLWAPGGLRIFALWIVNTKESVLLFSSFLV